MSRTELLRDFLRVRQLSEKMCEPLTIEDYVPQPIEDVSPPKWNLAHTSWYFETVLLKTHLADYECFHPEYAFLYNSYYESFGERWKRPQRGHLSRPTVKEVYQYRQHVNTHMEHLIETVDDSQWSTCKQLIELGIHHEQQHQELLLTDLKYILGVNPVYPAYLRPVEISETTVPPAEYVPISGGLYEMGHHGDAFAYDNEFPRHPVHVADFKLQNRLVTNGEYLEFVEDGGYRNFEFWLSDGWTALNNEHWEAPLYWVQQDSEWYEFTLRGLQKLNRSAPVCHVSYFEADAFAHWADQRLPTEAEWEVAAQQTQLSPKSGNFYDDGYLHPVPLHTKTPDDSSSLFQMLGDVWEWTNSAYLAYPGYCKEPGPLGEYNGKFMSNQMVLRGGSCATSADHIRLSYRNFFQPEKRWQFMGIRLAERC